MSLEGFLYLHRKFAEWEWYDDANTMRLFIHCLIFANYKEKQWRGVTIKRGQFITSQPKLAQGLKLSVRQIRTSLDKLKMTGELTVYTTADYSVITVKNYDMYQNNDSLSNILATDKRQSNDSLMTTTNNDNNDNNDNNSSSSSLENITKDEEEILKKYSKEKNKIKYFRPWLRKLIANGDLQEVLQKALKWYEKQQAKQNKPVPEITQEPQESEEEVKAAMKKAREVMEKAKKKK